MGGHAFHDTRPLSPAEHSALLSHVQTALAGRFTGVAAQRHYADKAVHGDLDVWVGWTGWHADGVAGRSGYELWAVRERARAAGELGPEVGLDVVDQVAGSDALLASFRELERGRGHPSSGDNLQVDGGKQVVSGLLPVPRHVWDAWHADIARAVGAVKWRRNGDIIFAKVPAAVLGRRATGFFQLDVTLTRPSWLPFAVFTRAYGITHPILATLLGALSPALMLTPNRLVWFHRPHTGAAARRCGVPLTACPRALCVCLGLDWGRWDATKFHGEAQLWEWFCDVPEASRGAEALRRWAAGSARVPVRPRGNVGAAFDRFEKHLQGSRWAATPPTPPASRARPTARVDGKGDSNSSTEGTPPAELDYYARDALSYWGMTGAYQAQVAEIERMLADRAREAAEKEERKRERVARGEARYARMVRLRRARRAALVSAVFVAAAMALSRVLARLVAL